jgi:hypothetical protein
MKNNSRALNFILLIGLLIQFSIINAQNYPLFGSEKAVTINGLNFDAMEPFISPDNSTLFFNNLNDGINTKLFYADRINDSTFIFVGEVIGANQLANPQLDAVADMDANNQFYWTSTRNYPNELDNLHYGTFNNGAITDSGRVRGDFNLNTPGWLIMDHGISYNGQYLYFNNARFDNMNCQGPCETQIGVAEKVNDSTFNTLINSDGILQNINDANYIYYAPCITADDLEFYYTRYLSGNITPGTMFDICVAVRDSPTDSFSVPQVLFSDSIAYLVEAPTLTTDKNIIYYHKKVGNSHEIKMRHRLSSASIYEATGKTLNIKVFPNPMEKETTISFNPYTDKLYNIVLLDNLGRQLRTYNNIENGELTINKNDLKKGLYIIQLISDSKLIINKKLIIE